MKRNIQPLLKISLSLFLILLLAGLFWISSIVSQSAQNLETVFLSSIESMITQRAGHFSRQFLDRFHRVADLPVYLLDHPKLRKTCDEKLELMRDQNLRYVYLLWMDPQGRFRFLCDGSDDKSHTMQKFDPDRPELWRKIYLGGAFKFLDQSQYRGLWKSLLYPLRDGNRTRAMLVIDYSTDLLTTLKRLIRPIQETLQIILLVTVGLVLFIFVQLLLLLLIRSKSIRDPLTGAYNRAALQLFRQTLPMRRYNLLMVDLDHFKRINDRFGHDTGDLALRHAVRLLRRPLKRKDYLIRHGGEEFLILQYCGRKSRQPAMGKHLAEQILGSFRTTPLTHQTYGEIPLRVSIGLYAIPDSRHNFDQMMRKTDLALYQAKNAGRDCYREVVLQRRAVLSGEFDEIKRYIEQDRIVCEYQPIFSRDGTVVVKYETLVRLRSDDGTLIYPDQFLDTIWQTNTYIRMTRRVLEKAIEMFRDRPLPFSVNLALQDLLDENIFELIREMSLKERETISRMSIEILEYHHFSDVERLSRVLNRFKELGISIILDDFGAGHANFLILQHLPIDEFKIDKKLIVEILNNPKAEKLLRTLTHYAKETGMKTTAEYVADARIFRALQSIPVDYLQGFYLGRPSPTVPVREGESDPS